MRADMWKVIVERPRLGRREANARGRRPRVKHRAALDDAPRFERFRRTKSLNENLAPLRRFLERQIGRPWDKVYSEMRAQISFDNVVQKHVLAHLDEFIWRHVRVVDGEVIPLQRHFRRKSGLYVDPNTGLIRRWRKKPNKAGRGST